MLNMDSILERRGEPSFGARPAPAWRPWGLTVDSALLCQRVRQVIEAGGVESALDVGCSVGLTTAWSAWRLPAAIHGIDINGEAIARASRLADRLDGRVSFRRAAYQELGRETFDLVFSNPPYIPNVLGLDGMDPSAVGVELVLDMLADPFRHVAPGGRILMVLSSASLACARVRAQLGVLAANGMTRRISRTAAPFRVACVLSAAGFVSELERAGAIVRAGRGGFIHHVDVWEFAER
jgi:methylase of polypeptide subunit release factors